MAVWHALPVAEVESRLGVRPGHGLSDAEVAERRSRHGPNRLTPHPGRSPWRRLLDQLVQPLVLVLVAAGAVTAFLGEWPDASVIFGVVVLNAAIGFWQEAKAEGALAALARTLATPVTVRREGHRRRIDAADLVPGDVVLLAAGDRVPADLRLFHQKSLACDESTLTGESLPVGKGTEPLPAATGLADRNNLAFAGTTVVAGQGAGVVVATGDATETGCISRLMAAAPELSTPLTRRMAAFSLWLLWAIAALAGLTFAVGLARGESAYEMFMAAVALAVGAIPEGLPAAVTVTLAIGVSRMARRRAIVRRLAAVETLGSTTVICSDKTGTLTANAMTVRALWVGGETLAVSGEGYSPAGDIDPRPAALEPCLLAGALCNDAGLLEDDRRWTITGDPTEAALLVLAGKAGVDYRTLRSQRERVNELPFDAGCRFMATLHRHGEGLALYAKGAAEGLLPRCSGQLAPDGSIVPVDAAGVEAAVGAMAGEGMRVLALAFRPWPQGRTLAPGHVDGLVLAGLAGMIDPPRPEAIRAVAACHAAGIRVKMITGDHALTAAAIAHRMGINTEGTCTGRELAALDDRALAEVAAATDVFARVEPEQKLRLVRALQSRGEVVAMTGDGVNDAPALKQADIGIAMGEGGTEVAKEAAAMVLTDDDFATIEAAVEEGRGIWDNLVKFITWTLPTNFGEGLVIVAAILLGVTLPITPLQILWINMTTAVLLGMPLAFEPIEPGAMDRPPRDPAAPVLDAGLLRRIVLVSALLLAGAFGLFLVELEQGHTLAEARTVAVNVFVLVQALYLLNCRSLTRGFWALGVFSNPWIWGGFAAMAILQGLLTYWPPCNAIFHTAPIGVGEWLEIAAVAWASSLIIALEKWWKGST